MSRSWSDHLGSPPIDTAEGGDWERSIRRSARHMNVSAKMYGVADRLWQGGSVVDAYRGLSTSRSMCSVRSD
jgi:hypothetical protein